MDILEANPGEKYFLSDKMAKYLMDRTAQTQDGHKPNLVVRSEEETSRPIIPSSSKVSRRHKR